MLNTPADILEAVDRGLAKLGLAAAKSVKDVLDGNSSGSNAQTKPRQYYLAGKVDRPLELVVCEELEVRTHGVVADHLFGTLGLIQVCGPEGSGCARIESSIQQAIYLRNLLLDEATEHLRPYSVELILVIPPDDSATRGEVAGVLRRLMRRTSYLQAIGVSVLTDKPGGSIEQEHRLRQAFPWLLRDVEAWYRKPGLEAIEDAAAANNEPGAAEKEHWKLTRLALTNFRLPGTRELKPADCALHVVHGHNGSGKSSLTEAFELMMTGRIRRLHRNQDGPGSDDELDAVDYGEILTYSDAKGPARLAADFECDRKPDGREWESEWKIGHRRLEQVKEAVPFPLPNNPHPGAYRLEQTFSDELIRGSDSDRARLFLEAFLPRARPAIIEEQQALEAFNGALDEIRKDLQLPEGFETAEGVAAREKWLGDASEATEAILQMSPISQLGPSFESLSPILGDDMANLLENPKGNRRSVRTQLEHCDDIWEDACARAEGLLADIEVVQPFLEHLDALPGSGGETGTVQELATHLNDWLEARVECDLMEKEIHLLKTIESATALKLEPELDFLLTRTPLKKQAKKKQETGNQSGVLDSRKKDRDAMAWRVRQFELAGQQRLAEDEEEISFPRPLRDAVDRLAPSASSADLSQTISHFLTSKESNPADLRSGGAVVLGSPGGCKGLIDQIEGYRPHLQKIGEVKQQQNKSLKGNYELLKKLVGAAKTCLDKEKGMVAALEMQLAKGPLAKAINELVALLTPARWVYEEVKGRYEGRGEGEFDLEVRGGSASVSLNTAELNTLSLACFLLCAPAVENPLRMLLLDDPLQNMDEMTVTAVARSIGRLLQCWQLEDVGLEDWRLVVLLHGEETMERFRQEAPCSAYFLPWLTASHGLGDPDDPDEERLHPIAHEESRLPVDFYPVGKLISSEGPPATGGPRS